MIDADREKRLAAEWAVAEVEDGMVVGLGTGTAASHAVRLLGARVGGGLSIRGVPTSNATRALAEAEDIPLTDLAEVPVVDLTIDGADELTPSLALTKGGGGALLFEKIVAASSRRMVVVAEAAKRVARLGAFPTPIEIVPLAAPLVTRALEHLGAHAVRPRTGFLTDGGHVILDADFGLVDDPERLAHALDHLVGVVEHGLFVGLAARAYVGVGETVVVVEPRALGE
jgi:ribose 5-phosphate isomerase A